MGVVRRVPQPNVVEDTTGLPEYRNGQPLSMHGHHTPNVDPSTYLIRQALSWSTLATWRPLISRMEAPFPVYRALIQPSSNGTP